MAVRSMFFNSTDIADEGYGASEFAAYFNTIIGDGVFPDRDRTGLSVSVVPGTMNVTIAPGAAFIKGHMCILDEPETLSLGTTPVFNRTDYIIMRLDFTRDIHGFRRAGSVYPFLLAGTPGGDPPALTRNNECYDILLCEVTVNGNTANLNNAALTDRRPDPAVCGFVSFLGEALEVKTGAEAEMPSPMSKGTFWLTPDGKLYVSDGTRNILINAVKSVNNTLPDASGNIKLTFTDGDISPFYGAGNAAAVTNVTIPGFKAENLTVGTKITVRISGALPYGADLNINNTGAHAIFWNANPITEGAIPSGEHFYEMIYYSNRWYILSVGGNASSAAAIVTGTYTGNGASVSGQTFSQSIALGFQPRVVIVMPRWRGVSDIGDSVPGLVLGGLATESGNQLADTSNAIRITATGFTVYRSWGGFNSNGTVTGGIFAGTNKDGEIYNFVAWR